MCSAVDRPCQGGVIGSITSMRSTILYPLKQAIQNWQWKKTLSQQVCMFNASLFRMEEQGMWNASLLRMEEKVMWSFGKTGDSFSI